MRELAEALYLFNIKIGTIEIDIFPQEVMKLFIYMPKDVILTFQLRFRDRFKN